MSEQELQNTIINRLRDMGAWCQRINSGKIFASYNGKKRMIKLADVGTPDIIACFKGFFLAFEIKKDEEEVKKWGRAVSRTLLSGFLAPSYVHIFEQSKQINKIHKAGGKAFVIGSVEQFEEALKPFLRT